MCIQDIVPQFALRDSSPENENSIIVYSPSFHFKPVCLNPAIIQKGILKNVDAIDFQFMATKPSFLKYILRLYTGFKRHEGKSIFFCFNCPYLSLSPCRHNI